eukprot:7531791-Heterocapsa_arctica.AAC.1
MPTTTTSSGVPYGSIWHVAGSIRQMAPRSMPWRSEPCCRGVEPKVEAKAVEPRAAARVEASRRDSR